MPINPVLYEVNTRCWLSELSRASGEPVTLAGVPEELVRSWAQKGFSHIWLMGVWQSGPRAAAHARNNEGLRQRCRELGLSLDALGPSPYAIAAYDVAPEIGTWAMLAGFRDMLHRHGMRLVLDFVPNHVGLDHPWIDEHPELFVSGTLGAAGAFSRNTKSGPRVVAHGKDPYFPAWTDTAQLDFRLAQTHRAVLEELFRVAEVCDGVRCDMAMLVLRDVFEKTWSGTPARGQLAVEEFWPTALRAVKARQPHFLLLAEAYWGLEPTLLDIGFDYVYDKALTDLTFHQEASRINRYLTEMPNAVLERSAHFLENHDEQRVNSKLPLNEHRAAALLTFMLPGMRFVHQRQMEGAKLHVPVQLSRWPEEPTDLRVQTMYEAVFSAMRDSDLLQGHGTLLKTACATESCPAPVVATRWVTHPDQFTIAAVNLSNMEATVEVIAEPPCNSGLWAGSELLGKKAKYLRWSGGKPLELCLAPWDAKVFLFRRG